MIITDPSTLKTQPQNIFGYIGNILLELNGKMDLPFDTSSIGVLSENNTYFGKTTNKGNRVGVTCDTLRKWEKIYDNGLKHDLVLIDNSEDEFFSDYYYTLSTYIKYTNSFVFHNNRNHYDHIDQRGGEKSALLLPIKFSTGCWAYGMGYGVIIHQEAKYTPDIDFDWAGCLRAFIDSELLVQVTPSRYGKCGFNHNIMIVKPYVWILLSRLWEYRPELKNTDLWDCYDAFNKLRLVWTDDQTQPYKYCDKKRFKLWVDSPSEWYRSTKEVDYQETETGYYCIRK